MQKIQSVAKRRARRWATGAGRRGGLATLGVAPVTALRVPQLGCLREIGWGGTLVGVWPGNAEALGGRPGTAEALGGRLDTAGKNARGEHAKLHAPLALSWPPAGQAADCPRLALRVSTCRFSQSIWSLMVCRVALVASHSNARRRSSSLNTGDSASR